MYKSPKAEGIVNLSLQIVSTMFSRTFNVRTFSSSTYNFRTLNVTTYFDNNTLQGQACDLFCLQTYSIQCLRPRGYGALPFVRACLVRHLVVSPFSCWGFQLLGFKRLGLAVRA